MAHITVRHRTDCATRRGANRCTCNASFQARVKLNGRKRAPLTKTFASRAEARAWALETETAHNRGLLAPAPGKETIRQAGAALIEGMRNHVVRDRSGDPYKPRTIDSYETSLLQHVYPLLGAAKVSDVRRRDIKLDRWLPEGAQECQRVPVINTTSSARVEGRSGAQSDARTRREYFLSGLRLKLSGYSGAHSAASPRPLERRHQRQPARPSRRPYSGSGLDLIYGEWRKPLL